MHRALPAQALERLVRRALLPELVIGDTQVLEIALFTARGHRGQAYTGPGGIPGAQPAHTQADAPESAQIRAAILLCSFGEASCGRPLPP